MQDSQQSADIDPPLPVENILDTLSKEKQEEIANKCKYGE